MKKLIVGLFFAVASLGLSAASLTLVGDGGNDATIGSASGEVVTAGVSNFTGTISDSFTLTTDEDTSISGGLSFLPAGIADDTTVTFSGTDGQNVVMAGSVPMTFSFMMLAAHTYTVLVDIVTNVQAYDYDLRIVATPIPAAIWLFGSMILGFFGLRSRVAK